MTFPCSDFCRVSFFFLISFMVHIKFEIQIKFEDKILILQVIPLFNLSCLSWFFLDMMKFLRFSNFVNFDQPKKLQILWAIRLQSWIFLRISFLCFFFILFDVHSWSKTCRISNNLSDSMKASSYPSHLSWIFFSSNFSIFCGWCLHWNWMNLRHSSELDEFRNCFSICIMIFLL